MIANALEFLLQTLFGLFTLVLLLRFYFQLTGVSYKNPISQSLLALTDFVAKPTRRFIPNWGNISLSVLFLAFLVQILLQFSLLWIRDFPFMVAGSTVWVALLALTLVSLLKLSIHIFLYAVILQAILSWVNPYTPVAPVLDTLTRPLLKPLRRFIPLVGGIDLSPIAVLIGAQLLLIILVTPLEQVFLRLI